MGSLDSRSFIESDDLFRHLLLIYKFRFGLRRFTIGHLKKLIIVMENKKVLESDWF